MRVKKRLKVLKALNLVHIIDDNEVAGQITPRL